MKILLVTATQTEISSLLRDEQNSLSFAINEHLIDVLITGVGMVATAFSMGSQLAKNSYDLAINAGIAGSFDRNLLLGDVVQVTEDSFAELGAEDGEEFLPIDKLGFGESRMIPVQPSQRLPQFKTAKAITVSRVHGNETTIYQTMSRLHPQIESMEGAAFFYACNQVSLPSVQLRAISNYVERRNRSRWDIGLAIENLNAALLKYLEEL